MDDKEGKDVDSTMMNKIIEMNAGSCAQCSEVTYNNFN